MKVNSSQFLEYESYFSMENNYFFYFAYHAFVGLLLEECPKWKMLHEVLTEIQAETNKKHKDQDVSEPARVLIAAADDRTCNQIKEVTPL